MRRPSQVSRVIDLLVSSERVDAMVVLNFADFLMFVVCVGCFVGISPRKNETGSERKRVSNRNEASADGTAPVSV